MKRVLIFSLAYHPHVGGAEVAIKEITDRIPDLEFHIITHRFERALPAEERLGNVVVHRVGFGSSYLSKILFVPWAAFAAARLQKSLRFDAYWAMMSYMLFPVALLRLAGLRVPYVLTLQEGDPFEHVFGRPHIKLVAPLLSYGFKHARVVQAISTFLGSWARERGYQGDLAIIPNAVDIAHFSQRVAPDDIAAVRAQLSLQAEDRVLITTSRLVKKNAVDVVIRALASLPENLHFVILGVGHDEVMLRALAKECGVERRVHFVGFVDHAGVPRYLAASDIFIRPSRSEGMGNSFVEAMVAGLPVVATQVGGIADFLFDARLNPERHATGWVVRPDSPEDITAAVRNILSNPAEVEKTVAYARQFATTHYDWDTIAAAMREQVFGKALSIG